MKNKKETPEWKSNRVTTIIKIVVLILLILLVCRVTKGQEGFYKAFPNEIDTTGLSNGIKHLTIDDFVINPSIVPCFTTKRNYDSGIGFNEGIVFIIEGEEVLRFFEDSIILFFKEKRIVIKEDSLCKLLDEITKETFNY